MRVIYVAGPYRSTTPYGVYQNIRKAEAVAIKLWKVGWVALCPHLNTQLFDQAYDLPPEVYLEGGLEFVRRCDAIYMMKDFRKSEGSKAELKEALRLGKEIYYETDGIPRP